MTEQARPALRRLPAAAALVCIAVTVALAVRPEWQGTLRSLELRLVVETTATFVALLTAYLYWGRFCRSRQVRSLWLAGGLLLLAVSSAVLLPALTLDSDTTFGLWLSLTSRLAGGALLLGGAAAGTRRIPVVSPGRAAFRLLGLLVLVLAVSAVADGMSGAPTVVTGGPADPVVDAGPVAQALQLATLGVLAVATVLFTVQTRREDDELLQWLAAATVLASFSRLQYLLHPTLVTDWLSSGDALRLGFYVLLLVGVGRETSRSWAAETSLAIAQERRRLARDLHDGAVQEIGYALQLARAAERRPGAEPVDVEIAASVANAAERSLAELRRALLALSDQGGGTAAEAVANATREAADRYDKQLELDLAEDLDLGDEQREALVRIAREAVLNAARHADSPTVRVALSARRLEVRDDGRGFDPTAPARPGHLGLTMIRDRAEGMGARAEICSAPGDGTSVVVTW